MSATEQRTVQKAQARRERQRGKRLAKIEPIEPVCVECNAVADLVTGAEIYPRRPDLHHKRFYRCTCGAYVGCHPGTQIPLGKPAGELTRKARNRAHNAFDILWRRKMRVAGCKQNEARGAAYKWLAKSLGYEPGRCHIGWMTADEANRVVALCQPYVHPQRAA